MNRPVRLSLALLGALAPACRMAPTYERPVAALPEAYAGQAQAPGAATFADVAWFDLFQDPVLKELVRIAIRQNADLQIAANRVLQTEVQVGIARSYRSPVVTSGPGANRGVDAGARALQGAKAAPGDQFIVNMGVSYELDFWGKLRSQTDVARAQFLASQENRNLVLQTLVTGLAQAYFQLRELDAELDLAQKTLDSRQGSLELVQLRRAGGVSSQSDVNQARSLVESAAHAVPLLQDQVAGQEAAINVLLGRFQDPVPRGLELDDQRLDMEVPPGLPSGLLERRPDVRLAEQSLIAANAQIGVAKAELFPDVQLTAGRGFVSSALASLFSPGTSIWNVGAAATGTIFSGGRLSGAVKLSELQQQQMVLQYAKALQQAFSEVSAALATKGKAREARLAQESLAHTLADQVQLANQRYLGGVASYLEVQDAERQSFDAERNLAQAKRDELLAVLSLYKALGGGWTPGAGS